MRVGTSWLVANIRSLTYQETGGGRIIADIDFMGEGDEERLTGKLYNFRRGVTRYPMPGCEVFPVTTADLKQVTTRGDPGTVFDPSNFATAARPAAMPDRR